MKKVSFEDDSYWKLVEIKAILKYNIWKELVDKLYDHLNQKKE